MSFYNRSQQHVAESVKRCAAFPLLRRGAPPAAVHLPFYNRRTADTQHRRKQLPKGTSQKTPALSEVSPELSACCVFCEVEAGVCRNGFSACADWHHKPHTLHTTHAQNPRRNEVNNAHYTTPAGNTGEYRKYWKDMRCHRDFPAFN